MKKQMYSSVLFFISVLLLTSCGNSKDSVSSDPVPEAIVANDLSQFRSIATATIKSVLVKDDLITIAVQYSGGCEDHDFKLVGESEVTENEETKLFEREVKLVHNSNGDNCRELVKDILVFDISAFKYDGKRMVLKIEGFEESMPYR